MIKNWTRNLIEFEFEGKTAKIYGETGFRNGHETPEFFDFVAAASSLTHWEPSHENEPFDDATKQRLLAALVALFQEKKWTILVVGR